MTEEHILVELAKQTPLVIVIDVESVKKWTEIEIDLSTFTTLGKVRLRVAWNSQRQCVVATRLPDRLVQTPTGAKRPSSEESSSSDEEEEEDVVKYPRSERRIFDGNWFARWAVLLDLQRTWNFRLWTPKMLGFQMDLKQIRDLFLNSWVEATQATEAVESALLDGDIETDALFAISTEEDRAILGVMLVSLEGGLDDHDPATPLHLHYFGTRQIKKPIGSAMLMALIEMTIKEQIESIDLKTKILEQYSDEPTKAWRIYRRFGFRPFALRDLVNAGAELLGITVNVRHLYTEEILGQFARDRAFTLSQPLL